MLGAGNLRSRDRMDSRTGVILRCHFSWQLILQSNHLSTLSSDIVAYSCMHFQDIFCVIYFTFSPLYQEVGLPFSQARDSMLMLLQSNAPMSIWTEEGEICCKFELLSLKVHQSTWSTFVRELCYYKPRQTCLISRAQAKQCESYQK